MPYGAESFSEGLRMGTEVFHALKGTLRKRGLGTTVGDEGGFAPDLDSNEDALRMLVAGIQAAGYEPGADVAIAVPEIASTRFPIAQDQVPATEHVMGGMPMGADPRTSVTDGQGRHHHLDNLFVADGAVFPSSGGHNPTLTIMATALRQATIWAGAD